ncbi:DUF2514 domain-containing protein [Pseudomonas sp. 148P]|uniref:DUF2514 domain-containing protein n=1 Tax=Pseudomonas ulcerans TaxID=3115852 RepID=A0ABU7HQA7_9PSED|nr:MULTISPECIES: DUF2514 domain-containing protein [unclassified Pseudomonas]MEE1922696.1 DUF2514 domain-containing protein [Pseudomonas sp. 147P]MEE1933673.1 DUF2514 domain-containing protein [Pseudomonas sp. 148P]
MISGRTAGAAVTLLLVLGSYWGIYQHGRGVERAAWEKAWAERDAADSDARAQAEAHARDEEQRRAAAQQKVKEDAQKEQTAADADAAGADDAGRRLRDEANKLAAGVGCPGTDTAAVARGKTATAAAMVLSDLLRRADERAGELAAAYDRARIAGLVCERSYDALSP